MAAPPGEDCLWRLLDLPSPGLHLGMHVCGCGGDGGKPLTCFAWLEQPEVCERHSVQWAVQFFSVKTSSFRPALSLRPCPSSAGGFLSLLVPLLSFLATLQRSLASPLGFGGSLAHFLLPGLLSSSASDMPMWFCGLSHPGQYLSCPPAVCFFHAGRQSFAAPYVETVSRSGFTTFDGLFGDTLYSHVLSHECSTTSRQRNCALLGVGSGFRGFVGRARDRSVALAQEADRSLWAARLLVRPVRCLSLVCQGHSRPGRFPYGFSHALTRSLLFS